MGRFPQYALTGAVGTLFNLVVFWLLTEYLGLWYVLASIAAFLVRSFFKFTLLCLWVYPKARGVRHRMWWFLGMEAFGLILGTTLLYLGVEGLGIPHLPALVLVITILYLVSFLASRHIVGKGHEGDSVI